MNDSVVERRATLNDARRSFLPTSTTVHGNKCPALLFSHCLLKLTLDGSFDVLFFVEVVSLEAFVPPVSLEAVFVVS